MHPFDVTEGDSPIILAFPHVGTHVPEDIWEKLNESGRVLADTDWHVDRLYSDLLPGSTMVRANFHRYVVDANRGPDDESLYPGQNTTGLCPIIDFDGQPLYNEGMEPDADEIEDRCLQWHTPYHEALSAQIERVRSIHGTAILFDCHSIRSFIPFLFEGKLPDFNVGTNLGTTCDLRVESSTVSHTSAADGYTSVLNGRFRGGWTTRHYGRPEEGIHAIQMELAQDTYLTAEMVPFDYDEQKAKRLRAHLKAILHDLATLAPYLMAAHVKHED